MSLETLKSNNPNFIIRKLTDLVHKIAIKTPSFENLLDFGRLYKFTNESSWTEINDELKLYKFSAMVPKENFLSNDFELSDFERFRPILLLHGYQSNHISWNWLVLQLWNDGFRQIYALEMADYRKGFDYNMKQLIGVVDYILYHQINYKKIDIIAHSMGGLVAKQYLKLHEGAKYIRLFISMGSPYKGVFKFWKKMAEYDNAEQSANDIYDKVKLDIINDAEYSESFYYLTQINIIGSMRRYFNTDGLFRNYPLPDMINYIIPTTHFNLNKTDKSYSIIKNFLFKQVSLFKIRLLSIHKTNISPSSSRNIYTLRTSIRFLVLIKDPKSDKTLERGFYPTRDRDELYFDLNEPFIPTSPIIVYCGEGPIENSKHIEISLLYNNKQVDKRSYLLKYSKNEDEQADYISLDAEITELNLSLQSNFAISKYIID